MNVFDHLEKMGVDIVVDVTSSTRLIVGSHEPYREHTIKVCLQNRINDKEFELYRRIGNDVVRIPASWEFKYGSSITTTCSDIWKDVMRSVGNELIREDTEELSTEWSRTMVPLSDLECNSLPICPVTFDI